MQRRHYLPLLAMALFFIFLPLARATEVLAATIDHSAGFTAASENADRAKNAAKKNNEALLGVTALSKDNAWAVGMIGGNGLYDYNSSWPLIEHWNGLQWKVVQDANLPGQQGILIAVSGLNKDDVWAVGMGDNSAPIIEHWDGQSWHFTALSSPSFDEGGS